MPEQPDYAENISKALLQDAADCGSKLKMLTESQQESSSLFRSDNGAKTSKDLPQITIHNFGKVSDGIYPGAAPTESQIRELKNLGIRTIIDLRIPGTGISGESRTASANGIKYHNEPLHYSSPHTERMAQIITLLNKPENQPVYVHCREGQDRTGTVIGTERRIVFGWDWKSTYTEMLSYGFHPAYKGLADFVQHSPEKQLPVINKRLF